MSRKTGYQSDVTDEEWALIAPYLALIHPESKQRKYPLRDIFNGLRWIIRAGAPLRLMPNDLPPWELVYQQTQRWIQAGVFEDIVHDLREILRIAADRNAQPTAVMLDSRTLQSTPESGGRGGYDGVKKRKGSKVHMAVDTLGHLLALVVTPADEQDRSQVVELAKQVQDITEVSVEIAYVDQGYNGQEVATQAAIEGGIELAASGEIPRVQEGLCVALKTLGRGTLFWLVGSLPKTGQRRRKASRDAERPAFFSLCFASPTPSRCASRSTSSMSS